MYGEKINYEPTFSDMELVKRFKRFEIIVDGNVASCIWNRGCESHKCKTDECHGRIEMEKRREATAERVRMQTKEVDPLERSLQVMRASLQERARARTQNMNVQKNS